MSCQDVKAITLRPGVCRFKAEIQFNPTTLANKYLDGHPDNLPGIKASFTRALHHSRTPPSASRPSPSGARAGVRGRGEAPRGRDLG